MKPRKNIKDMYEQFENQEGSLGGYKAYAWQLILSASEILFVSQQGEIAQMITLLI